MWEIITEYIEDWLKTLDQKTLYGVFSALEVLKIEGPNLKRPLVGEIILKADELYTNHLAELEKEDSNEKASNI